jgi:hypothetical protein
VNALHGERDEQKYATGTAAVVSAFRLQVDLGGGEVVDETTAKELNKLLQASGGLDTSASERMVREEVLDVSGDSLEG